MTKDKHPALYNTLDWSLPGSSVYEIFQARILEWVAISYSRGCPHPRDQTRVSCIAGRFFTHWANREAPRTSCLLVPPLCLTLCNSMDWSPNRLLCPWNSPGKSPGLGSHSLPHRIFPTQGLNPGILHCRWTLHCLSCQGNLLGS